MLYQFLHPHIVEFTNQETGTGIWLVFTSTHCGIHPKYEAPDGQHDFTSTHCGIHR